MAMPKPLPGLLRASFRGIEFYIPEMSSIHGRRIAAHYFPGLDYSAYDDHGLSASQINFDALYVGNDYIAHGRRLKAAFEMAGPGTLIHPWFGAINAILLEPAEISFSSTELRVVRISVSFEQVTNNNSLLSATLPRLLDAILNLVDLAFALIDAVDRFSLSRLKSDAISRISHALLSAYQNTNRDAKSFYMQKANEGIPSNIKNFKTFIDKLSNKTLEDTQNNFKNSAVSPAASAKLISPKLTPKAAISQFLKTNQTLELKAQDFNSLTDKALLSSVIAHNLGKATRLVSDVDFSSRREAFDLRLQLTSTLNAYSNSLQSLFESSLSSAASDLNRAAQETRIALIHDINEAIGRLPQTSTLEVPLTSDAWMIANLLYGDDPDQIEAGYADIVKRNRLAHPAAIMQSRLEILK